ncbi:interactor of constitutive active ROPs 4-like [Canna indica]|uniref:Interactor of constitutive active ROPs 4-like n=1 Tax=Canna indica TaxID=4628 RepID=A0AAQ3JXI5_9LILI|nr:interactor of constitutive active ROPs 4-like [Canna indica]
MVVSRGSSSSSQVSQRHSSSTPRLPLHLRATACSEINGVHRPVAADRSPRVSPRGSLHERKKSTRTAEMETKLGKAQEELKKLRNQLASVEAAKLEAQQALAKAEKRIPAAPVTPVNDGEDEEEKPRLEQENNKSEEESISSPATMDVFEVVAPIEDEVDSNQGKEEEKETKTVAEKKEGEEQIEAVAAEKEEDTNKLVDNLKAELLEKEKEVEILLEWNSIFKAKASEEAKKTTSAARAREAELMGKLNSMEKELQQSRAKAQRLAEQLEAAETAKAALETEMKRLRVQTEQWRKAAEAAAAALVAGDGVGVDEGERRTAERCGSMDKHLGLGWGSPMMSGDVEEEELATGGRRKTAGIRMFGDLWRKKGQQHK